jgi:hypothetical protein
LRGRTRLSLLLQLGKRRRCARSRSSLSDDGLFLFRRNASHSTASVAAK